MPPAGELGRHEGERRFRVAAFDRAQCLRRQPAHALLRREARVFALHPAQARHVTSSYEWRAGTFASIRSISTRLVRSVIFRPYPRFSTGFASDPVHWKWTQSPSATSSAIGVKAYGTEGKTCPWREKKSQEGASSSSGAALRVPGADCRMWLIDQTCAMSPRRPLTLRL